MKFRFKLHSIAADSGSRQKGFTLIELLIVIAIIGILGGAIYSLFHNISTKSTAQRTAAITQQKARLTLEMMSRDIRMLGLDPMETAGAGLWVHSGKDALANDYISFSADLNCDGDIDDEYERIAYFIDSSGTLIMRTFVTGTPGVIELPMLTGLTAGDLSFKYFNANNEEFPTLTEAMASNGANLFAVEITLTVRSRTAEEGTIERTYSTVVKIRNRNI